MHEGKGEMARAGPCTCDGGVSRASLQAGSVSRFPCRPSGKNQSAVASSRCMSCMLSAVAVALRGCTGGFFQGGGGDDGWKDGIFCV